MLGAENDVPRGVLHIVAGDVTKTRKSFINLFAFMKLKEIEAIEAK
jgi:hypothetical protein